MIMNRERFLLLVLFFDCKLPFYRSEAKTNRLMCCTNIFFIKENLHCDSSCSRQNSIANKKSGFSHIIDLRYEKHSNPGNISLLPRKADIRRSLLYLAVLSPRQGAPVFIWPVPRPTAISAIVVSSVSPER